MIRVAFAALRTLEPVYKKHGTRNMERANLQALKERHLIATPVGHRPTQMVVHGDTNQSGKCLRAFVANTKLNCHGGDKTIQVPIRR